MKQRYIIKCIVCSKERQVKLYELKTAKFCSYGCNAKFNFTGKKRKPMSDATKQKIREHCLKNPRRYWLGKKRPESGKFLSDYMKKNGPWNKGIKGYTKGLKHTDYPRGDKHWSWKGGVSRDTHSLKRPEYREWRTAVFERDNWKCRIADINCDGQLQAHHILRWSEYPELRYVINNGITLCVAHHPRKRAEEKRLAPKFFELVSVSKVIY
jgi:hypothetical protein